MVRKYAHWQSMSTWTFSWDKCLLWGVLTFFARWPDWSPIWEVGVAVGLDNIFSPPSPTWLRPNAFPRPSFTTLLINQIIEVLSTDRHSDWIWIWIGFYPSDSQVPRPTCFWEQVGPKASGLGNLATHPNEMKLKTQNIFFFRGQYLAKQNLAGLYFCLMFSHLALTHDHVHQALLLD